MAKSVKNQRVEVGVRELKSKLSHYIDLVQHGSEVIVTEHGKPVVKLVSLDKSHQQLQQLIDAGLVKPPLDATRPRPKPIKIEGSMSELLIEMRGE
ncbi:MAG: type II toxin-antitoxin system prevent-host-death family antitoxin [Actinobacteria bacterium]|jgi:prevent-host-death family protein|nr:type II toxin-antitoxin system prevent-host-death family antitoxin [Actinomycetota bacterium]